MKRRRLGRTAFLLLGLCLTLWRLPATIEAFAGTLGSGGTAKDSIMSAMGVATGLGNGTGDGAKSPSATTKPKVISAGGKALSDAESERLMRQARAMAPLPLDGAKGNSKPGSPEDAAEEIQRQIDEALKGHLPK